MDNIRMAKSYLRQAEERLKHAKEALSDGNYAYVIRQSQEAHFTPYASHLTLHTLRFTQDCWHRTTKVS